MALTLLVAGAVPLTAGCGPIEFLPSPFTPQNVELIYSAQEDITIVRWRISSDDPATGDLHFELLGEAGYHAIDFSQSVYTGGTAPCGDGTGSCFQYVQRGAYPAAWASMRPVRGVHSTYGVLPGGLPKASTVTNTLALVSFFHTGNDLVYVNITDVVGSDATYVFPRPYVHTIWPTKGLCLSDSVPDDVEFSPLDATGGFASPSPLSDDGIYCVGIQAVPNDAGDAALAQTRVATLPQVATLHVDYSPPIQPTSIVYQIIFDLEVSAPGDRCENALSTIEHAIQTAMQGVSGDVVQLQTINLAVDNTRTDGTANCTQPGAPSFDADTLAETMKQKVSAFPETYAQVQLFYFNNLDSPLPQTLTDSFGELFTDLAQSPPGHVLSTVSWLFAPPSASLGGPSWSMSQSWKSTDDPTPQQTIAMYAQNSLPFQSQILDPINPQPFLSKQDVTDDAGGFLKICNVSGYVQTVGMQSAEPIGPGPSFAIDPTNPPGFFAILYPPINDPANLFTPVGVSMDVQVCTRYCTDHPYVSTANTGVLSWTPSSLCATTTP